jgi:hypothetical protein
MTPVRLNIIVEGQTEEGFVKKVLAPHLGQFNVFCSARCIETSRRKHGGKIFRGGMMTYSHLRNDLFRWLKQDNNPDAFFSMMIDLYRSPADFPDFEMAMKYNDPFAKVACLEQAMARDINHPRFLPYIQLHEFEALLFCDAKQLCMRYPERSRESEELAKFCETQPSPDFINDGASTAPSKRIIEKIPEYENEKAFAGPLIAEYIGLENLKKCIHFAGWLEKLEHLAEK